MNCEDAQAAFASHLDGEELGPEEAEALEGHLADCSGCGAQARQAAATHRDLLLLRALEADQAQASSPAKASPVAPLERRKGTLEITPGPSRRPSVLIEAAAAMVLAAVLAFLLWPTGQPSGVDKVNGKGTDPVAQLKSPVGLLSACQGRVEGKTAGDAAPVSLERGDHLAVGQEIHTARESFAVLDLAGGTVIRLEAESTLRLGEPEKPRWVMLLRGRGHFDVKKRDELWHVQTPNATVETSEGVFFVRVQER